MEPFDRVIISADENVNYLPFWPLVSAAWRKFFNVQVHLAFVTHRQDDDALVANLREHGEVTLWPCPIKYPIGCYAKIARYLEAAKHGSDVCLIADIDSAPLQRRHIAELTGVRWSWMLLTYGKNVYDGGPHKGKWPSGWLTAEGSVWQRVMSGYTDGLRIFDMKESPELNPDTFSDESMLRALVYLARLDCIHVNRELDFQTYWIDREDWRVNVEQLTAGQYIEVNFLRPPALHWDKIKPVADYLLGHDCTREEALLCG